MRRVGETAKGRTGEAHIRAAGSMSLRRFPRQGERIGLMRCRRLRPFAVSPFRPLASWLLSLDFVPNGSSIGARWNEASVRLMLKITSKWRLWRFVVWRQR
jgi:hypothetical protein